MYLLLFESCPTIIFWCVGTLKCAITNSRYYVSGYLCLNNFFQANVAKENRIVFHLFFHTCTLTFKCIGNLKHTRTSYVHNFIYYFKIIILCLSAEFVFPSRLLL